MDRPIRPALALFGLLVMCAVLPAQRLLLESSLGPTTPVIGGADVADAPVLDYYGGSENLPDLGGTGLGLYGGVPGYGHYPVRGLSWVQLDYLLWWVEGQDIPPLATTQAGDVVFGQEQLDSNPLSGVRLQAGHYFDCDGLCGVMVDLWGLGNGNSRSGVVSPTSGAYQMPFTDMDLSLPSNAGPDGCACLDDLTGTSSSVPLDSISTSSSSDIWSGGVYYTGRLMSYFDCCASGGGCCPGLNRYGHRLNGLVGYRYLSFDESLAISGVLAPTAGPITARDVFRTQNRFNGLDFGLLYERDRGRWSVITTGRVALGVNSQELTIAGSGNQDGGIFAQYTNIGTYEHDAFTAIPQLDFALAYAITPRFRARIGYSFLYLSNVIRPAAQVDTRLDGRFLDPTETARPLADPLAFFPRPKFETESVWLQGMTFGFDYSF